MTQNQEGNREHFRTVFMRELVGTWDRSEGVSGPAQWLARLRGGVKAERGWGGQGEG